MQVEETAIPDVRIITPRVFSDDRGFFLESWHSGRFAEAGLPTDFVQDNHSSSRQGALRGLHYQVGEVQGKLVRVVRGEVFDVAVDLRRSSPTFGTWVGETLSEENRRQLWIPPGFAHGFYVVSDVADVLYKCTGVYSPESERSLAWNDPELAIDWPLVLGAQPLLSEKDAQAPALSDAEVFP